MMKPKTAPRMLGGVTSAAKASAMEIQEKAPTSTCGRAGHNDEEGRLHWGGCMGPRLHDEEEGLLCSMRPASTDGA